MADMTRLAELIRSGDETTARAELSTL
ncbi:MAG: hypothetical protein FD159_2768, partial [Syntrophaceae bacterium]